MLPSVLGMALPGLSTKIPTERRQKLKTFANGVREIASELLDKATKEKAEVGVGEVDKSIIGALGEERLVLKKTPCVTTDFS